MKNGNNKYRQSIDIQSNNKNLNIENKNGIKIQDNSFTNQYFEDPSLKNFITIREKLQEKELKIVDLNKIIDSLCDLNNKLNIELKDKNKKDKLNVNEGKDKILENEVQTLIFQMQNEKESFEKYKEEIMKENLELKSKLSELIHILENQNQDNNLKKRTDQLEIFFFNFTIFVKNILQKEFNFDNAIFIELECFINNLREKNSVNQNYISIQEHHQIMNRLNIKVNELNDKNRLLQYKFYNFRQEFDKFFKNSYKNEYTDSENYKVTPVNNLNDENSMKINFENKNINDDNFIERSKSYNSNNHDIKDFNKIKVRGEQNDYINQNNTLLKMNLRDDNPSKVNNITRYKDHESSNNYDNLNYKLVEKYDNLFNKIKIVEQEFKSYVEKSKETKIDLRNSLNHKVNSLNKSSLSNNSFFKDKKRYSENIDKSIKTNKSRIPSNLSPSIEKKKNLVGIYKKKLLKIENDIKEIKRNMT